MVGKALLASLLVSVRGESSGELGCGVAIAGDWPQTGTQFDESYNFDIESLMASAQKQAGPSQKLWRYDWRSSEHPRHGDWTYVAMDWCPVGGKEEHPDPDGPFPGMLGWNEPNAAQQCNQPPGNVAEFVALAKQFKQRGKFVVSPAPTHDQAAWLDGFLGAMHDRTDPAEHFLGVDYLAYHHYVACNTGNDPSFPKTSAEDIYQQLETILKSFTDVMYKWNDRGFDIKGLWLTEVSCGWEDGQWTGNCGEQCVRDTMAQLLRLVHEHKELVTWSWFPYNNFGSLWENDKDSNYPLTEIGKWYFGTCTKGGASSSIVM